jgi:hypothetical protein
MSETINTVADAAIEHHKTFPTGNLRLLMLLKGMKFEIETGMKLTRGPKCSSRVKKEFNLKGNAEKVYYQFLDLLVKHKVVEFLDDQPAEEPKVEETTGN